MSRLARSAPPPMSISRQSGSSTFSSPGCACSAITVAAEMTSAGAILQHSGRRITPQEAAEERALLFAVVADGLILVAMGISGFYGGSLTMMAETIRGTLMALIEVFAY